MWLSVVYAVLFTVINSVIVGVIGGRIVGVSPRKFAGWCVFVSSLTMPVPDGWIGALLFALRDALQ